MMMVVVVVVVVVVVGRGRHVRLSCSYSEDVCCMAARVPESQQRTQSGYQCRLQQRHLPSKHAQCDTRVPWRVPRSPRRRCGHHSLSRQHPWDCANVTT